MDWSITKQKGFRIYFLVFFPIAFLILFSPVFFVGIIIEYEPMFNLLIITFILFSAITIIGYFYTNYMDTKNVWQSKVQK